LTSPVKLTPFTEYFISFSINFDDRINLLRCKALH